MDMCVPATKVGCGVWRQRFCQSAILWISMTFSVSGCAIQTPPPPLDPALLLLHSVANEVGVITRRISDVQQQSYPLFQEPKVQDPRLLAKITVLDYVGPPGHLLQELATRIGYNYVELGSTRLASSGYATPFAVTVTLRSKQQTVLNIIREVAAQVGRSVVVSVSEAQQELRLEYL